MVGTNVKLQDLTVQRFISGEFREKSRPKKSILLDKKLERSTASMHHSRSVSFDASMAPCFSSSRHLRAKSHAIVFIGDFSQEQLEDILEEFRSTVVPNADTKYQSQKFVDYTPRCLRDLSVEADGRSSVVCRKGATKTVRFSEHAPRCLQVQSKTSYSSPDSHLIREVPKSISEPNLSELSPDANKHAARQNTRNSSKPIIMACIPKCEISFRKVVIERHSISKKVEEVAIEHYSCPSVVENKVYSEKSSGTSVQVPACIEISKQVETAQGAHSPEAYESAILTVIEVFESNICSHIADRASMWAQKHPRVMVMTQRAANLIALYTVITTIYGALHALYERSIAGSF